MNDESVGTDSEKTLNSSLMESIREFCQFRDDFLKVTGLQDRLCSKMKRLSDSILDVIQIFTELTPFDIDLINREMSIKNFLPSESSTQIVPYSAIDLANKTWTKMQNLVEEIYYYFENKKLFRKIAKFYCSTPDLDDIEDEVKSIFAEYIYTILMKIDGSSAACISYIFLWLKTAAKRELLDTGIGQCRAVDILSFDEIDEESDKKRNLHEVIGYTVDYDSYVENNSSNSCDVYSTKEMKKIREKIFYESHFYTSKGKKQKTKSKKEVLHV